MSEPRKKLTIPDLRNAKRNGERIVLASVTDYLMAQRAERGGIDIVAVGDSLGMITYGHPNTLPMTVDQMIEHIKAVRRGAPNTLCIAAMPFGSYATPDIAIHNALRLMKGAGAIGLEIEAVLPQAAQAVDSFTFSIGAGGAGCGQLLLGADLIGAFDTFKPKFAKRYGNIAEVATGAFAACAADIRDGAFPDEDHVYKMNAEEAEKLATALAAKRGDP